MTTDISKQLTLPFEVLADDVDPQYAEIVKQNWQITFSRQKMGSVYSKRVMGLIAAQIKEDQEVQEYYQITADRIVQGTPLTSKPEIYRTMKDVVYELSEICFYLEDETTGRIIPRHLLDTTRFKNPAGYYDGKLTVAFNPHLKGVVARLAHFSEYELKRYMSYRSWYTMRLYEMLEAFSDKPAVEWGIEKYRDMMGCGAKRNHKGERVINPRTGKLSYEKYPSHSDMVVKTTKEPLKELKGSDLEFTVTPVYEVRVGRGRPAIEKVRFEFVKPRKNASQRIEQWCRQSEDFNNIYNRLKKFKVSDGVIVQHCPIIGRPMLQKLLYDWNLRTKPDAKNRIDNPEKYCNKVLKDLADKMRAGEKT